MNAQTVIQRHKHGKHFTYRTQAGTAVDIQTKEWIDSLVIPPAWKDVQISGSKRAKVLATGYDKAGKQQAIYNPVFRKHQEKVKFDRVLRFAEALPRLRRQVEADLRRRSLPKDKVLACIVKLIDEAYFRIGNDQYAQEHQTYGITTLRSKHLDVTGDTVTFDFIGKSGKKHIKQISDRQIARIVKQLDEQPGYEIFRYIDDDGSLHDVSSADVNAYIKTYAGEEFTAKDFRTWGGTLLATTELIAAERLESKKERQKFVTSMVKNVAKRLGNTPAVCKSSYIDPRVINAFIDSKGIAELKETFESMKPKKYLSRDEQCVLRLLS